MKHIEIIYSRIEVVYQNIHLRIDIYAFVSKFINNIFFHYRMLGYLTLIYQLLESTYRSKLEEDEEDDEENLT